MKLRRTLKVLGTRWWVIALVALLGAGVGIFLARSQNDAIEPRWKAEAPVTFIQLDETEGEASGSSRNAQPADSSSGATVDVDVERARALLLLEETLEGNELLSIKASRTDNTLFFVAVGRDGEETLAAALSLRGEYESLGATVLSIEQIEATIETLLAEIDRVKVEIVALEVVGPEPEDGSITARRTALQSEIDVLYLRQAQLRIWISNPELRPSEKEFTEAVVITGRGSSQGAEEDPEADIVIVSVEALTAERDANAVIIDRLAVSLSVIPDPPVAEELDARSALEIDALTLDLADFELQYVDLLRRSDGRPPGGFFVEPVITDLTPSEVSTALYAVIGLVVGAILASAVLIALDATRQPIWAPSDLEGVVSLGVVDRDRTDGDRQAVWYPASVSRRRRDIQIFRAATDAITEEMPAVIGITGIGVSSHEVGEVAADLASAYTVAGRNVLLVDGSGFHPNTLPEFGGHDDGLNVILTNQMSQTDAATAINRLLESAPDVAPNLTAVRVGGGTFDPFDAFASPSCRLFMDIAKSEYDTVVLAGPDIADPLADAVARRADFVVLVGMLGHTTSSQFAAAVDVLSDRQTDVAGAVLLRGPRQSTSARIRCVVKGDVESAVNLTTRRAAEAVAWIKALFGGGINDVATLPSTITGQADSLELEPESEAETRGAPATVVAGSPLSGQDSGIADEDLV